MSISNHVRKTKPMNSSPRNNATPLPGKSQHWGTLAHTNLSSDHPVHALSFSWQRIPNSVPWSSAQPDPSAGYDPLELLSTWIQ
jgi:hypothetical protein